MGDSLKEWKLIQAAVGLVAACGLVLYIASGSFVVREWLPFLPAPALPDTLLFHIDTMRQHFAAHRFAEALRESEYVLAHKKGYTEAIRVRAACLLRVGRFEDAEKVLRVHITQNKYDLGARIDLALALRGQNKNNLAQGVLLRLMDHPLISVEQKQLAQNLLTVMTQPGELPPSPEPTPVALPSPQPSLKPLASPSPALPPLTIRAPRETPDFATPAPVVRATPLPEIPALVLPKPPTPQPEVSATPEPSKTEGIIPVVDIDVAPTPAPTPRPTLSGGSGFPRKILSATLPLQKKAPIKKAVAKSKARVLTRKTGAHKSALRKSVAPKSPAKKRTLKRGSPARSPRGHR